MTHTQRKKKAVLLIDLWLHIIKEISEVQTDWEWKLHQTGEREYTWTMLFLGDGCVVNAAEQKAGRGTVPIGKEHSMPFVFGLEEEE